MLRSLQGFRLLQIHHLRRLHFNDHASDGAANRVARRIMQRLHGRDLVHRLERRIGGIRAGSAGHIYALSPLGHRVLGRSRRARRNEPALGFVQHTLAIAEIATGLVEQTEQEPDLEVLTLDPESYCWRHPEGTKVRTASTAILKPDLHLVVADGDTELSWFIEIDCGSESSTTIARKCRTYTDYYRSGHEQRASGIFPKVLWIAPDQHRQDQIHRAIHTNGIEPALFETTIFEHALHTLTNTGDQP